VGTLVLAVVTLAAFRGWPSPGKLADIPWWAWVGGLLGTFYVLGSIVTSPRLGAVAFVAIIVAGQSVASLGPRPLRLGRVRRAPRSPPRASSGSCCSASGLRSCASTEGERAAAVRPPLAGWFR
jgi:uncharacterized membrane protein YdcZ (DUF606 family)